MSCLHSEATIENVGSRVVTRRWPVLLGNRQEVSASNMIIIEQLVPRREQ